MGVFRLSEWLAGVAAARVCALGLALATPVAFAQNRAKLEEALQTMQAAMKAGSADLKTAEALAKLRCSESEIADEVLSEVKSPSTKGLADAAIRAHAAAANCEVASDAERQAKSKLTLARSTMRKTASLLAQCVTGGPCATVTLVAAAAPAPAPEPPGVDEKLRKEIEELLQAAGKSQAEIDGLRARSAKAYDIGDKATAAALGLDHKRLGVDAEKPEMRQRALDSAATARLTPADAKRAVGQAQYAADHFVASALALKACLSDKGCVVRPAYDVALEAKEEMARRSKRATSRLDGLDKAGYALDELKAKPETTLVALDRATSLRKLLDSNPDVKSYFGDDSFGVTAGNGGTSTTLRYTLENPGLIGRGRVTLIASSPTVTGGLTSLYDTADRFKDKAKLTAAFQTTRAGRRLESINVIEDWALGVTLARDERKYLVTDGAATTRLKEETRAYIDWGLGGRYVLLLNPEAGTRLLQLSFDLQRTRSNAKATARQCSYAFSQYTDPADSTKKTDLVNLSDCVEGPLGAPSTQLNRLVGLSFKQRQIFGDVDLGFSVKHSLKNHKTDVEVPIYFVRLKNAAADGKPLSGGLVTSWTSKVPGLKWGLFVSTPLNFTAPSER